MELGTDVTGRMPAFKRQHYLPAGYLRYFSIDQNQCSRDSSIWRIDENGGRVVRVGTQCSADYHYSKKDPQAAERNFQEIEKRYYACVDKIKSGQRLTDEEYGQLLICMFDFNIRNAVHKNNTGKEGFEAYMMRWQIFWDKILLQGSAEVTPENIKNHVFNYWDLSIISAPRGKAFITSDHPSVWTCLNDNQPALHLLSLPLTPTYTAIAFDKRIVTVADQPMSDEDYLTFMDSQMSNAVRCFYSSVQAGADQLAILKARLKEKFANEHTTDPNEWSMKLAGLSPKHYFSFIRMTFPRM